MSLKKSFLILAAVVLPLIWMSSLQAGTTEEDSYLGAMQQFNQHDWDRAQRSLLDFQARFPNSRWSWAVKLRLADLESDPERAEKLYREVITQKDASEWAWEARWGLASGLYARGRYPEARELYKALSQSRDVRRVRAQYFSGLCALAINQPDAARKDFTEILDHHAQAEVAGAAMIALGDAEVASRHPDAAQRWYNQYLQENPEGELAAQARQRLQTPAEAGNTPAARAANLKPSFTPRVEKPATPVPVVKTATPLPKATAVTTPVAGGKMYCVQVGAFSKIEYAHGMVKKLQNLGLEAFIQDTKSTKEPLHMVRVGPFATRAEAERQAGQLTQNEGMPTLVVPVASPRPVTPSLPAPPRKKK